MPNCTPQLSPQSDKSERRKSPIRQPGSSAAVTNECRGCPFGQCVRVLRAGTRRCGARGSTHERWRRSRLKNTSRELRNIWFSFAAAAAEDAAPCVLDSAGSHSNRITNGSRATGADLTVYCPMAVVSQPHRRCCVRRQQHLSFLASDSQCSHAAPAYEHAEP